MRLLLALLLLAACARIAPTPETLAGTSWRLVKFQGGDGQVLAPDERSKYTLFYVRSYTLKNGRLYLSMMADGGVFELEPLP